MIITLYILSVFTFIYWLTIRKNETVAPSFLSINYTTSLRSIAILMVILHHIGNCIGMKALTPLGGAGVALFLIISGYGLNESFNKKGLCGYWKSKLLRVVIPCWFIDTISAIIQYDEFDISTYIQCLFCIKIDWYIRYLFYWYFIFYITSKFFAKQRIYLMLMISTIMLCVLPEIESEQSISFILGVLFSYKKNLLIKYHKIIAKWSFPFMLLAFLMLAIKQTAYIRNLSGTLIYNIIQLLIKSNIALFLTFTLYYCRKIHFSHFITFTGIISYELYLVHCKLLFIIKENCTIITVTTFLLLSYIFAFLLYKTDTYIKDKSEHLWQK